MDDDFFTGPIRVAVASGEFQQAQQLWTDYVAQLSEDLRQGSFSEGRLRKVGELVEWSRRVVLCARSHAQDSLNSMHVAGYYDEAHAPQVPRLIQTCF